MLRLAVGVRAGRWRMQVRLQTQQALPVAQGAGGAVLVAAAPEGAALGLSRRGWQSRQAGGVGLRRRLPMCGQHGG